MRATLIALFLFASTQIICQNVRHVETINECWSFYKGELNKPFEKDTATHWDNINLPHTWNNLDVLDDKKGYYRGIAWYKKSLKIPYRYENQQVFLHFEAANQVTTVFINGKKIGADHIGGYTPFVYDITPFIEDVNEIAVKVNNSHNDEIVPLGADFNFYGGIYRDVHLIITKPSHFEMLNMGSNGVFITTPKVSEELANVSIQSFVVTSGNPKCVLKTTLVDANRNIIARAEKQKAVNGKNETTIEIQNPTLWSPANPYLYTLVSELTDKNGNIIDRVENPVGFRWFKFDAKTGFYINGKHLKLIGTNRHQDFYQKGNAVSDEIHRNDMKLLKEMGINFLRISHYPQDPAILEMCDRYGFIATLEIPFVNQAADNEKGLANSVNMMREAIRSNYNHPCIVAWCTGNETTMNPPEKLGDDYTKQLQKTHKTLADVVKEEDSTRYSYTVFFKSPKYQDKMGIRQTEICGYNKYVGWYGSKLEDISVKVPESARKSLDIDPDKPYILSEYGAGSDPRIRSFHPSRFDFSIEYQLLLHKEHLKAILKTPEIAGANVWNFADFQVESRIDAVPHVNNKGLVTVKRELKDVYYFYQAALNTDTILVIPSKLWKKRAGIADAEGIYTCTQAIEVFSNLKQAELFLNGNSLGIQSFDFFASTWQVPFINGTNLLEVRSVNEGKEKKDFMEIDFKIHSFNLKDENYPYNEIAVNVGSDCYFIEEDNMKYLWIPDQKYREGSFGYVGGEKHKTKSTIGSKQNIQGSKNDPIYQSQLIGIESYKFDVPNGNYELSLYFAEVDAEEENEMNIVVNGQSIWQDLNIKEQYGTGKAISKRFTINVTENTGVKVDFQANKGTTRLSAIKLRKVY